MEVEGGRWREEKGGGRRRKMKARKEKGGDGEKGIGRGGRKLGFGSSIKK